MSSVKFSPLFGDVASHGEEAAHGLAPSPRSSRESREHLLCGSVVKGRLGTKPECSGRRIAQSISVESIKVTSAIVGGGFFSKECCFDVRGATVKWFLFSEKIGTAARGACIKTPLDQPDDRSLWWRDMRALHNLDNDSIPASSRGSRAQLAKR